MRLNKDIPFTVAPNALIQDATISPQARFLYVYMASMPDDWEFYMGPLASKMQMTLKTLRKYMQELETTGWLTNDGQKVKNGIFGANQYTIHAASTVGQNLPYGKKSASEKSTNKQNKETTKDIVEKPKGIIDDVKEVVNYLNEQSESAYRHTTKKTQAQIKARMKEGFTVEDFKKAIRHKVRDWKGTPMQKYLRPETLFGAKFESYLQEAEAIEKLQASQTIEEQYKQGYNAYLDWMKKDFPELVARVQYLSPKEYKSYWLDDYLKNAAMVGRAKKRRILQDCHKQFVVNPNVQRNYETVWGYYCQQIKQHIKSASVC